MAFDIDCLYSTKYLIQLFAFKAILLNNLTSIDITNTKYLFGMHAHCTQIVMIKLHFNGMIQFQWSSSDLII